MKKRTLGATGVLMMAGLLAAGSAQATTGGMLSVPAGGSAQATKTDVNSSNGHFATFTTNLNGAGANIDVTAMTAGSSFSDYLVLTCSLGDNHQQGKTGTNTSNGDILLFCNLFSQGVFSQYFVTAN